MINRGLALRSSSHAGSRCAHRGESYLLCVVRGLCSNRDQFLSDGSSEVSLGCVLTLWSVQIWPSRGAVSGMWWMCPRSLSSIYQKISTDLWAVWAALRASSPTLAGISILGHCSVSGGYEDRVLYLVLPQYRSQEVCRLKAEGFVLVLGVSDRSSVLSWGSASLFFKFLNSII